MSSKHNIKNIFDWLNHITYHKTPSSEFTEEDWDKFNSYMVNRFISMDKNYVELANYVQITPYDNKEQLYNIYKEYLPKKKMFFKYLKSSHKSPPQKLVEEFTKFFECSVSEAESHVKILKPKDHKNILSHMGYDEKEIKQILK
jgi:hypothetical protein